MMSPSDRILREVTGVGDRRYGSRQEFLFDIAMQLNETTTDRWLRLPLYLKNWYNEKAVPALNHGGGWSPQPVPEPPSFGPPIGQSTWTNLSEVITFESQGIVPGRDFI